MSHFTLPSEEDFDPDLRRAFEFADQRVDPKLIDHSKVKMRKDSLKLSGDGTFYTLQGEGPTMGLPCVFCRLHVCNLKCTWCDAWYTWNPNTPEFWTEGEDVPLEEVAERIRTTWGKIVDENGNVTQHEPGTWHKRRVIFTGGEPLIQRKQIDLVWEMLDGMGYNWEVEFETNGTLMPTDYQLKYAQFNCSPKLRNSDNRVGSMVRPKILEALNGANTTFKFVCFDEKDLEEIEELYLPHISPQKVVIMPQGIYTEEIDKNMRQLYEPCMKRGYRLLGRMQSQFADGARRGV